jgi:hypothetical protein
MKASGAAIDMAQKYPAMEKSAITAADMLNDRVYMTCFESVFACTMISLIFE